MDAWKHGVQQSAVDLDPRTTEHTKKSGGSVSHEGYWRWPCNLERTCLHFSHPQIRSCDPHACTWDRAAVCCGAPACIRLRGDRSTACQGGGGQGKAGRTLNSVPSALRDASRALESASATSVVTATSLPSSSNAVLLTRAEIGMVAVVLFPASSNSRLERKASFTGTASSGGTSSHGESGVSVLARTLVRRAGLRMSSSVTISSPRPPQMDVLAGAMLTTSLDAPAALKISTKGVPLELV